MTGPATASAAITPLPRSNGELLLIIALFPLAFLVAGLLIDPPSTVLRGLLSILTSRDTLITDCMGLGGIGAALVNAGLLTLMANGCNYRSGAIIGGAAIACLLLVLGFGLFGKSRLHVWFIVSAWSSTRR